MAFGTNTLSDTLAANRTLIAQYGQDRAYEAIKAYLDAHNAILADMITDLAEPTTDRLRRYGGVSTTAMQRGDEFSRPDAQKIGQGVNTGFPLEIYQAAWQVTADYMRTKTVAELAAQVDSVMTADVVRIENELERAVFNPTNNLTYADHRVDNLTLQLRAFVNADSTSIPAGPTGVQFNGATHTHFLGTSSLVAADLQGLIDAIVEHYNRGRVRVYINRASEVAVRALTGFQPYVDQRIVQALTTTYAGGVALDVMSQYNRAIGIFSAAEVWVKPWIPTNYMFAFNPDQRKPLVWRTRDAYMGSLHTAAQFVDYPLQADFMEREFGFGVQERVNGAALYLSNSTYAAPTIA